jgi:ComF family protein
LSNLRRSFFDKLALAGRQLYAHALPQSCVLCAADSGPHALCPACEQDLPRLPTAHCPVCALPTPQGAPCGDCLQHHPAFDHTVAAWSYAWPLDRLIPAFKYSGQLLLARPLADGLHAALRDAARPDLILPMPLHPQRLRERGFNQSQLLAKAVAKALDCPWHQDVLERIKLTPPQASLPREARRTAIKQAFRCRQALSGLHIAVVDDVMTTGASLNEVAATLKQAGAQRVDCWVLARTLS